MACIHCGMKGEEIGSLEARFLHGGFFYFPLHIPQTKLILKGVALEIIRIHFLQWIKFSTISLNVFVTKIDGINSLIPNVRNN